MKALIGIPLHNEQAYLSECIRTLFNFINSECKDYDISVLLVDDGSTDKSQVIYENLALEFRFQTIRHSIGPLGYGNTILTLFRQAKKSYDILITFDADLQHAPFTIKEILQVLQDKPQIDLVSTSRYLTYRFWDQNTQVPIDRYITNMLITRTINRCFPLNIEITDAFCGLKGYRTRILPDNMDHAGYSFPLVFWSYSHKNNLIIDEIETPIIYRLDRRPRGEWKHRLKDYFSKIDSLVHSNELKKKVQLDYQESINRLTEVVDHCPDFPILTYHEFFKSKWYIE